METVADRMYSARGEQLRALSVESDRTYDEIRRRYLLMPVNRKNAEFRRVDRIRRKAFERTQRRHEAYRRFLYAEESQQ